MRYQLINH